jgi:hypothetical protein
VAVIGLSSYESVCSLKGGRKYRGTLSRDKGRSQDLPDNPREYLKMSRTILNSAIIAGLLLAGTPIVASAADAAAPKTKSACEKTKDMKWDDATKACVKK